ncbi:hypothetical protein [Neorhizobium tomejilense]|uniref:hypothetical protein n=1 Tax=Neorhizobium tomejilense TaxID=2093828 RepID=UPI00155E4975|nr:hypothetical protein [Neorhizobium tomejilense]
MRDFPGFVYLNIENPMVAWNTVKGWVASTGIVAGDERDAFISFNMAGLLSASGFGRLVTEIEIERVRRQYYPHQVSRLTGLFVFDDVDSVAQTWSEQSWGGHFDTKYLTDVGVAANRYSRVDANWITRMMDQDANLVEGTLEMIHSYWGGVAAPYVEPVWECIVEGWVTVWGRQIKLGALAEIQKYWPSSVKLLEYAGNAAALRSLDGAIYPHAKLVNKELSVEYYIRRVDAKRPEFSEQLGTFMRARDGRQCFFTSETDLVTPDFQMYNISRHLSDSDKALLFSI